MTYYSFNGCSWYNATGNLSMSIVSASNATLHNVYIRLLMVLIIYSTCAPSIWLMVIARAMSIFAPDRFVVEISILLNLLFLMSALWKLVADSIQSEKSQSLITAFEKSRFRRSAP